MCGQAYLTSARIAEATGPFPGYAQNEEPFLEVIRMHRDAVAPIEPPQYSGGSLPGRDEVLGRCATRWAAARLPQRAGDGDRAHRAPSAS